MRHDRRDAIRICLEDAPQAHFAVP